MTLLRRADAVQRLGLRAGMAARIAMPEMGIDGWARVNAITAAAGPADASVPHVSGTFRTSRAAVVEVLFEDGGEPLVGTPTHPVWSLNRETWVPLGELQPGERVAAVFVPADGVESTNDGVDQAADARSSSTPQGERRVREMRACAQPTVVYNAEVSPTHTYVAGCVWVHNPCFNSGGSGAHVYVNGRTARAEIGYLDKADDILGILKQAIPYARSQGASRAVCETGPIINQQLLSKLAKIAARGGTKFGGRVTKTGRDKFEIVWEMLPSLP